MRIQETVVNRLTCHCDEPIGSTQAADHAGALGDHRPVHRRRLLRPARRARLGADGRPGATRGRPHRLPQRPGGPRPARRPHRHRRCRRRQPRRLLAPGVHLAPRPRAARQRPAAAAGGRGRRPGGGAGARPGARRPPRRRAGGATARPVGRRLAADRPRDADGVRERVPPPPGALDPLRVGSRDRPRPRPPARPRTHRDLGARRRPARHPPARRSSAAPAAAHRRPRRSALRRRS